MRKLSCTRYLRITYMGSRKETGVIGDDGYICTIIAHLIEYSILELHKYVQIFLISGVKISVVILRLRGHGSPQQPFAIPVMSK